MSERSPPDLLEAPIREIVVHTIDNGTPRDMSRENDHNTNKQMPEVNVTVSSDNSKYNEQDKNKHTKTTSLTRSIDMTTNETRLNLDNVVRRVTSMRSLRRV